MRFYSKEKLMSVAGHRGYTTARAIGDALSPIFGISSKRVQTKIRSGKFTKEECEVIGSFFDMTMKEYYDVFMHGLFQEDECGHYVCTVKEPWHHLHPLAEINNPNKHRIQKIDRIIEELKEIDE